MPKKLPARPNLDHLRRQSKVLLAGLNARESDAARAFIEHLPEATKLTAAKVFAAGYRLADAQSVVARQSGSPVGLRSRGTCSSCAHSRASGGSKRSRSMR